MTIRFYFNEDTMPHSLVRAFTLRGINVITALNAVTIERPNVDHFACASSQHLILSHWNSRDICRWNTEVLALGKPHTRTFEVRRCDVMGTAALHADASGISRNGAGE